MPIFGAPKVSAQEQLESYARVLVRAGVLSAESCEAEVAEAARRDAHLDDPVTVAHDLVARARDALTTDQRAWPQLTDYGRLQAAFADLRGQGIEVLQSVEDHWRANAALRMAQDAAKPLTGVVWFTAPDIWHAVEHGMLEINVWHGDSANIAEGDALLDSVIAALAGHGLDAHYDEGRVEVSAHWHRRLGEH